MDGSRNSSQGSGRLLHLVGVPETFSPSPLSPMWLVPTIRPLLLIATAVLWLKVARARPSWRGRQASVRLLISSRGTCLR